MKPVDEHDRQILNIYRDQFTPYPSDNPAATSGESYLQLDVHQPQGYGFHVYKMAPGTTTTPHEHNCDEQFLVLEGELVDHDGARYGPGDLVLLRKGSRHSSYSENGCLLAVFIAVPETPLTATEDS